MLENVLARLEVGLVSCKSRSNEFDRIILSASAQTLLIPLLSLIRMFSMEVGIIPTSVPNIWLIYSTETNLP